MVVSSFPCQENVRPNYFIAHGIDLTSHSMDDQFCVITY